eukprot:1272078-Lingulodinium_polyedra.AAC.1
MPGLILLTSTLFPSCAEPSADEASHCTEDVLPQPERGGSCPALQDRESRAQPLLLSPQRP